MVIDATVKRSTKPPRRAWLTELQNELALNSMHEAKKVWPGADLYQAPYYNEQLEQVQQIERDAFRLQETIQADSEVLSAAVWLHRRFESGSQAYPVQGAAWAQENLAPLGFPADKVEQVVYAILHHNDLPGAISEDAVEARLLWDAIRLSSIGPLQVVTDLCARPAFPDQKITFSSMALLGLEKLETVRKMIPQFYFEASRTLAQERYQQQKAFYQAFAQAVEA